MYDNQGNKIEVSFEDVVGTVNGQKTNLQDAVNSGSIGGGSSVTIDKSMPGSPSDDHVPSTKLLKEELKKKADALPPGTSSEANQVAYTNPDGSKTNVQEKLTELESAVGNNNCNAVRDFDFDFDKISTTKFGGVVVDGNTIFAVTGANAKKMSINGRTIENFSFKNSIPFGTNQGCRYSCDLGDYVLFASRDSLREYYVSKDSPCGEICVVNKSDLTLVNSYNTTFKVSGGCKFKVGENTYIALGEQFGGWEIWDVTNPLSLVKISDSSSVHALDESKIVWVEDRKNLPPVSYYNDWEYQGVEVCEINGHRYLIGCGFMALCHIWNIDDVANPSFIKSVEFADLGINTAWKLHSQECVIKDGYGYFTFGNQNASAASLYKKFGIIVIDITSLLGSENIIFKMIELPEEAIPIFSLYAGDSQPNRIVDCGNYVTVNASDKGVGIFSANGLDSKFLKMYKSPYDKGIVGEIKALDDGSLLYLNTTSTSNNYKSNRVVIYKFD